MRSVSVVGPPTRFSGWIGENWRYLLLRVNTPPFLLALRQQPGCPLFRLTVSHVADHLHSLASSSILFLHPLVSW